MTLSKSGRFRAEASFQQPPPSSISSINLSYCSLSVASFIAAKHIALARAHHPRQPNPHSVCGSSLAQSTRGFVLWRLPDAGPGARRSISHGRHPKPLYGAYRCQIKSRHTSESFCHVTRLHCGNGCSLARLRCAERSSPEAACGAPKARGLTANAQTEPS